MNVKATFFYSVQYIVGNVDNLCQVFIAVRVPAIVIQSCHGGHWYLKKESEENFCCHQSKKVRKHLPMGAPVKVD